MKDFARGGHFALEETQKSAVDSEPSGAAEFQRMYAIPDNPIKTCNPALQTHPAMKLRSDTTQRGYF